MKKFTEQEDDFIKANHATMTNRQLAIALGRKDHTTRNRCYELGLYKMEMEYWTKEQVRYLKLNYCKKGDKEIAEIFNTKWPKNKKWTLKHIEKKRMYLKLKRTAAELKAIKEKHKINGSYVRGNIKTWETRGAAPIGSIVYWKTSWQKTPVPYIKLTTGYIHWARWCYETNIGAVPSGMNVVFKDGNRHHLSINNLELITNAELAKRNAYKSSVSLSDNYVVAIMSLKDPELRSALRNEQELIDAKRHELLLNRRLNYLHEKQNKRSA